MLELQILTDEQANPKKVTIKKTARAELTGNISERTKSAVFEHKAWEPWLIRSGVSMLANEGVSHIGIYTDFV